MIHPQRMQRTEYRRPRKVNAVSLSLLAFLGLIAYLVYSVWPAMTLRLRVKSELEDVLPNFWRMNLRSEEQARIEIPRMKRELMEKLPKLGVRDKHAEVVFERGKKRVAIEARFATTVTFPVLNRTKTFQLAPRAETDAARVEW
jgi:hypothetical protein